MADASNAEAGPQPLNEEQVRAQSNAILNQLKNGELRGRVKVVLILGPAGSGKSNLLKVLTGNAIQIGHRAADGTRVVSYHPVRLRNERFVFIDTPGFGVAGYNKDRIQSLVRGALGFATCCFGGIHGILYILSIETGRLYPGVIQGLAFLSRFKREDGQLPPVTFVTTKWDRVRDEERQIFVDKLADFGAIAWREFANHGHVEFGCNYDYSRPERRQDARAALVEQLADRYGGAGVEPVEMPFWEWTWGEISTATAKITGAVAGGCAVVIGFVGLAAGVASGAVEATGTFILESGGDWGIGIGFSF